MRSIWRAVRCCAGLSAFVFIQGCHREPSEEEVISAVASGNVNALEKLLKNGAPVNSRDRRGLSALSVASLNGDISSMRVLAEHGANLRQRGGSMDPLCLAVESGSKDAVAFLLERKVSPDGDGFKEPPLGLATNVEVANMLLDAGANPSDVGGPNKEQPLMMAVRRGQLDVVKRLISAKANLNGKNARGLTALHYACMVRNSDLLNGGEDHSDEIIKILLEAGANVNIMDAHNSLPIHLLAQNALAKLSSFEAMIRAGADLKQENQNLMTPLVVALISGRPETDPVIKLLRKTSGDKRTLDQIVLPMGVRRPTQPISFEGVRN